MCTDQSGVKVGIPVDNKTSYSNVLIATVADVGLPVLRSCNQHLVLAIEAVYELLMVSHHSLGRQLQIPRLVLIPAWPHRTCHFFKVQLQVLVVRLPGG